MNKKVSILVVDDNSDNLTVVGNYLKQKDYNLALAQDGKSALEIVNQHKIDLILLDIMMPEMDGYEVCRILKENPETKDIPVIFLTARTDTEDVVQGFQMGGVDYITKPFRKEELFARVNNHIQLKMIRDYLVQSEKDTRKSRDYYMRTLHGLSKIIFGEK